MHFWKTVISFLKMTCLWNWWKVVCEIYFGENKADIWTEKENWRKESESTQTRRGHLWLCAVFGKSWCTVRMTESHSVRSIDWLLLFVSQWSNIISAAIQTQKVLNKQPYSSVSQIMRRLFYVNAEYVELIFRVKSLTTSLPTSKHQAQHSTDVAVWW